MDWPQPGQSASGVPSWAKYRSFTGAGPDLGVVPAAAAGTGQERTWIDDSVRVEPATTEIGWTQL